MNEIPLFPLPLVVFPGGVLPLQIFEPRYLDMVRDCVRDDHGFGVVMIEEGDQVIRHAQQSMPSIHHMGTTCRIVDFDQHDNGMLAITAVGEFRFVIRDYFENDARLMMADVEFLPGEDDQTVPEPYLHLTELLVSLLEHESVSGLGINPDYESAVDVSSRLTELMPIDNQIKQRLFELKDPMVRLQELDRIISDIQGASD